MSRLPNPGGDEGTWGQVLNDFLSQSHNSDGSLKTTAVPNGSITQSRLGVAAGTSGQVLSTDGTNLVWTTLSSSGTALDATTGSKGVIRLAGDLAGTAIAPTVPGLTGKANTVHSHTVSQLSDSTATGRSVVQAVDAAAARTVIGAGTSNLILGTTNTTAKAGDYAPTKADIGLGNVDNTSDASKPVSTAVQTALNAKANTSSLAIVATSGSYADLSNKPAIPAQLNATAGTNMTISGTYPNLTFAATPGAGVTDISIIRDGTSVTVNSSTGADGTIAAADGTNAGVLSSADKTKLDSVASGATVNTTDAQLRDRSTHTGTQAESTVTNLVSDLAGKEAVVTTGTTSQYYRGDKTWQTLDKTVIGLGSVDNTSDINKPVSTATQSALNIKSDSAYTINAQTGTSYTLATGDAGKFITMTNAGASTLTVPTNATVAFPVGSRIAFVQMGAGQVTVVAAGGVAVYADPGLKIAAQYGGAELVKLATDIWILVGRLAA